MKDHSDIDVAVFVETKDGISPRSYYKDLLTLDLSIYDLATRSDSEVRGGISSLFVPGFWARFMGNKVVLFDDIGVIESIKGKQRIWGTLEKALGLEDLYLQAISHRLFNARRRTLDIEEVLSNLDAVEPFYQVKRPLKGLRGNPTHLLREILDANGVYIGPGDNLDTVIREALKLYPEISPVEPQIRETLAADWGSTDKDYILDNVHKSREIVEFIVRKFDERILKYLNSSSYSASRISR
jgi:hypothetical protein